MHTTNDILDAIAAKRGGVTDYRLSKLLETSTQTVNNWRKGRTFMSTEFAHRAAGLLEWDPAYVVACVEHERALRASSEDSTGETGRHLVTWERIAKRFAPKHATGILLAMLALFPASKLLASEANFGEHAAFVNPPIYTLCALRWRRLRRRIGRFIGTVFPALEPNLALA